MTSVRDIILVAAVLFAVGISLVFIVKIGHQINTQLLITPSINSTASAVSVIQHADTAINSSDYIYLALFIGFFISIIIFGWLVGGTTIMAPIYFFIIILFTFVSIILQEAWKEIATHTEVITTIAQLPITNYILSHLGYFIAIMGIIGIIAMYAKPYVSDNTGVYQ